MTVKHTGERTFFSDRGVNRIFDEKNLQIENEKGSIILLGYGGILDALNKPNEKYGTDLVKAFHDLKEKGLVTAMDVASMNDKEEMQRYVIPSLKYVDYLIVNEIEGGELAEMEIRREDGSLNRDAMEKAARKLMTMGVQKCCVFTPRKWDAQWTAKAIMWERAVSEAAGWIYCRNGRSRRFVLCRNLVFYI